MPRCSIPLRGHPLEIPVDWFLSVLWLQATELEIPIVWAEDSKDSNIEKKKRAI